MSADRVIGALRIKKWPKIVEHILLEIIRNLGVAFVGRSLLAFRLLISFKTPWVILQITEIGRRRVQRMLEAWVHVRLYLCSYPLLEFRPRLFQKDGLVAKQRMPLAKHGVDREPQAVLVEVGIPGWSIRVFFDATD